MASKTYCDRTGCGREIPLSPKRIKLQGREMDLCNECFADVATLLETPPTTPRLNPPIVDDTTHLV